MLWTVPVGIGSCVWWVDWHEQHRRFVDQTIADYVRGTYPGAYNDLSDTEIEQATLRKHPGRFDALRRSKQPGRRPQHQPPIYLDDSGNEIASSSYLSTDPNAGVPIIAAPEPASASSSVVATIAIWLLPPIALYACGFGVAWVRRGFRAEAP
jgi:hypothetical protein